MPYSDAAMSPYGNATPTPSYHRIMALDCSAPMAMVAPQRALIAVRYDTIALMRQYNTARWNAGNIAIHHHGHIVAWPYGDRIARQMDI